jgi:hypothetical protein
MHRKRTSFLLSGSVLLLGLSAGTAYGQSSLRWNLQADDVHLYRIVEEARLGTGQRGLTEKLVLDTTWTVVNAEADLWEIAVTFDRIQFTASGDVGSGPLEVAYDSTDQRARGRGSEALKELFKAITRSQVQVKLDTFGHMTDPELPQELSEQFRGNASRELAGFFGDTVSIIGLKRSVHSVAVPLPEDVVSADDTWTHEYKLDVALGELTAISGIATYTFLGPRREVSIVRIREQAEEELELAPNGRAGVPPREVSGSIEFDASAGLLLHRTSTRKQGNSSEVKTTVERKPPRE